VNEAEQVMILSNLWRRKTRTALTLLGIAIGVAAVVALSAFSEGLAGGYQRVFASNTADLTVGERDARMLLFSTVEQEVGDELRALPGVEQVAGKIVNMVTIPDVPYFIVMGEDPRSFAIQRYRLLAGPGLTGRKQILLGSATAENFAKQVGDTFVLEGVIYRVAGIYETGESLEDGGAVISLADAQRAFDRRGQVNYFEIKLRDPARADTVKQAIESRWSDLTATRSGEVTQQAEMLGMFSSLGLFVGGLAAVVGGLGMMNTMLMSVLERTREIGVLRALGWTRLRVLGLILGEALALAMLGGALGVALGAGLMQLASLSPAVSNMLSGALTLPAVAQALAMALLLGLVGGLYPAWRAAQLQPVEAMRYESGASGSLPKWMPRLPGAGALRNLLRRPARTFVTLAGLGLGVGFMVSLIAVTEGFGVTFTQLASAGEADLMVQSDVSDMSLSEIDERTAAQVARQSVVKGVSRILFGFPSTPETPLLLLFGLDPAEDYIRHYRIRDGRLIQREGEIVLGRFAAESMKKRVGDRLVIGANRYTVVGIYENGSTFEDLGGMLWLRDAQELLNKRRKVSFLAVAVNDPARAGEAAATLEAQFPGLVVNTASSVTQRVQDFQTTYAVLNTLIALTMVVGGVVMTNTMLMSVFERTQEIGLLRALGWGHWRVVSLVVAESLALSVLGAGVGLALGIGLATAYTFTPQWGGFFIPAYPPRLFLQVLALAVTLGALGGLYPAWRAAGLRPIEALRYE
jgi:ABC-type antimicrobial peptide transport system permease subunit